MKIALDLDVFELEDGSKQAQINYLLGPGQSLPPTVGLSGATDDQAIFNLLRGQTPKNDLAHALAFLFKAVPLLPVGAPAAKPEKSKSGKES